MSFIAKLFLSGIWLVVVPAFSGSLFLRKKASFCMAESMLTGYLFLFALGEFLSLFMMYLNLPLHVLSATYAVITVLVGFAGLCYIAAIAWPSHQLEPFEFRKRSFYFWLAIIFILIQVVVLVYFAHLDADDGFYVGAATTAVENDSIFRFNAYTGAPYKHLPRRYIYSPFPILLAVFSQISGNLHAAILAHTVIPAVFVPLAYMVMHLLSRYFFPDRKEAQGIFLFLTTVLSWFSAYSIYNAGDFQMIRIWQGKAALAAVMFPFMIYLSLCMLMEETAVYTWLVYFMAAVSCCLLSSMGIILAPVIIGLFALLSFLRYRSIKRPLIALLCCLPSIILGAAYLAVVL